MLKRLILPLWIIFALFLFFYSFTQVDLSLTLSKASFFQSFQKFFQQIGYFQRPLSANLYLLLLFFGFALFLKTLYLASKEKISRRLLWATIIIVSGITFFSYNAFSYDLFNYIFDAKIVTYYSENPYLKKALDYPTDPMLSFMHWTHRTYPYGPTWLGLTVPLSYAGLNVFLFTFYLFKILGLASYLGTVFLIEKILRQLKDKNPIFGTAFFALNPLVLIESLVSSHNDIVMVFFAISSLYLLLKNRWFSSLFMLLVSGGVKFATLILIPVYLIFIFKKKLLQDKLKIEHIIYLSLAFMCLAVLIATFRTNFQPWYLIFVLPYTAFLARKLIVAVPALILSISSLLNYYPYIREGNWNPPIPSQLNLINLIGVFLSLFLILAVILKKNWRKGSSIV